MLILGVLMIVPLLQKQLKEIKMVSVVLFISIGLFIVLMTGQLAYNGPKADNSDTNYHIYYTPKWQLPLMTSIGIILTAYGFQQNLFPIWQSLADQSNEGTLVAIRNGLAISFIVYSAIGVLSLYVFGS